MNKTVKAVRASFIIGDISLNGFLKPDASYCLSQSEVCSVVNKDKRSMRDFLASNSPYALPFKALSRGKSKGTNLNKIKIEGDTAQNITEVPLDLAFAYWMKESQQGNEIASNLVFACGIESLERRLDKAFNRQHSEEERNAKLAQRLKGKLARRTLTDSIQDYLLNTPGLSSNYKKFIWSNCSNYLNKQILGVSSSKAKQFYNLKTGELLRDKISPDALRELEWTEALASRYIDDRNLEPFSAVKKACSDIGTRFIGL